MIFTLIWQVSDSKAQHKGCVKLKEQQECGLYGDSAARWHFVLFRGHQLSLSPIKLQIHPLCNNSSALIVRGLKCASFVPRSMLWPFVCGLFYTSTSSIKLIWLVSQRQLLFVLAPITPISQSLMNHTHWGRGNGVMSSVITPITGVCSLQIPPWVCCV